jgi:hypothetical protein
LIQINEHFARKETLYGDNLGVLHAGLDQGVGAGVAHSTGQLSIQFRRGAKGFGRIRNSDTRRFE